uniref:JmjC domain-containing protein n=1 Tax=Coccolithus braarudii TaxID=221442 RepID=A0A7S0LGP3_9EUKA
MRRLAVNVRAGGQEMQITKEVTLLADALAQQLDCMRLKVSGTSEVQAGDGSTFVIVELSSALAAIALLGAVAFSRSSDIRSASVLLDGALLRARAEKHTHLLQRALAVLESEWETFSGKLKRKREDATWVFAQHITSQVHGQWARVASYGAQPPVVEAPFSRETVQAASAPLLLAGIASTWPAVRRWSSPSYLQHVAGHRLVPIEVGAVHLGKAEGGVNEQQVLRTLSEFIEDVILGGRAATADGAVPTAVSSTVPVTSSMTLGYLAQHRLFDQVPMLAKDISHPVVVPPNADCRAWFGPANVATPVHFDFHHGLLVQVIGCKRVLLWPPTAGDLLQAPPTDSSLANTSPLDPLGCLEGSNAAAMCLRASCVSVVLEPGNALLIPQGWWHYACSLTVSFSVSFWWDGPL